MQKKKIYLSFSHLFVVFMLIPGTVVDPSLLFNLFVKLSLDVAVEPDVPLNAVLVV